MFSILKFAEYFVSSSIQHDETKFILSFREIEPSTGRGMKQKILRSTSAGIESLWPEYRKGVSAGKYKRELTSITDVRDGIPKVLTNKAKTQLLQESVKEYTTAQVNNIIREGRKNAPPVVPSKYLY